MDHYQHPVKFPKEWKIETLHGGQWKPFELYTTDRYDTRANQYNVVHPSAYLRRHSNSSQWLRRFHPGRIYAHVTTFINWVKSLS